MLKEIMIEKLVSLARLDYDVLCAYEEALKLIDKNDKDIYADLILYRNDHALHVNVLSTAIADLGGVVPPLSPSARGGASEGLASLPVSAGTAEALQALRQDEELVSKAYADAIGDSEFSVYPMDIQEHLKNNRYDDEHHLSHITSALNTLVVTIG